MKGRAEKRAVSRGKRDDTPLVTIGDLRKRLRRLGNPWEPDPTLSDDEPIPRYPTGGDGTVGGPGQLGAGENLTEFLRKQGSPPSNIELRKVWRKAGLLDKTRPLKPGSSQKRDRSDDRG